MTNNTVMPLKVERASLAVQAQSYLRSLIEDETYRPGEQLPSENKLATQLGISRPTLREALQNLEQKGVIIRKHGVGTFVAPGYKHRLEGGLERLESVLELAARQGMQVQSDGLKVSQEPADAELAEKLQVSPGTLLTVVERVIVVSGNPVAYMWDVCPSSILSPSEMNGAFDGSVLDLLRKRQDQHLVQAVANIVAVNADSFLSQKLEVGKKQALLLLEETVFSDDGAALEFSRNYFIPEFFNFYVVRH